MRKDSLYDKTMVAPVWITVDKEVFWLLPGSWRSNVGCRL